MMKEVMRAMEYVGSLSSLGLIFCIAGFLAGSLAILSVRRSDIDRMAALPIDEKDQIDE
ncbi:MAG: hypothetical protein ACI8W8_001739 [Rhodothermales bacterium]|jgi:hypothetical protein